VAVSEFEVLLLTGAYNAVYNRASEKPCRLMLANALGAVRSLCRLIDQCK